MKKRTGGLADSPFFTNASVPHAIFEQVVQEAASPPSRVASNPAERDSPPELETSHGIVVPRYRDTTIERIRKAVREFGKEAATHRFTRDEKLAVADIIHALKVQGLKTSENEIARIAINFLILDYRQRGVDSILTKTIKALKE